MAYKFQPWELDKDGVPFSKKAGVFLEKDGVVKSFKIQEDVDAAWASGWHDPGKPETADVPLQAKPVEEKPKKRSRRRKKAK